LSKIKNTWLKLPVGVSPLQLVNLHRNRRYFVIKLHTWFCLSYFLRTNIKFYCIYQYFIPNSLIASFLKVLRSLCKHVRFCERQGEEFAHFAWFGEPCMYVFIDSTEFRNTNMYMYSLTTEFRNINMYMYSLTLLSLQIQICTCIYWLYWVYKYKYVHAVRIYQLIVKNHRWREHRNKQGKNKTKWWSKNRVHDNHYNHISMGIGHKKGKIMATIGK
jgi:hypothetical protein